MRDPQRFLSAALSMVAAAVMAAAAAVAQSAPPAAEPAAAPVSDPTLPQSSAPTVQANPQATPLSVQPLLDFRDSEVKFNVSDLMDLLRDRRHEGWVLAAYPDPKTGRPLIGAGFSLDLPERQHPQSDPLNSHSFDEPSSAELWEAAGLDPNQLQTILEEFNDNLAAWRMRRYQRRVWSLAPQITDDQASLLLRIAAIQAIENARAYCRNFDQLTGPQQMALSQLVYQMGVNLEEFGEFLSLINNGPVAPAPAAETVAVVPASENASPASATLAADDGEHWKAVQQSLIQSQWARLYRARAVSVIAMLDAQYLDDPGAAEQRIAAVLRPAVAHRRRSRAAVRTASYQRHSGRAVARKASGLRNKRKV